MRLAAAVGTTVAALLLGTVGTVAATAQERRAGTTDQPPPGQIVGDVSADCSGNGTDGPRVQLMTVTVEGAPPANDAMTAAVLREAAVTDTTFAVSTEYPATARRVRWVTDAQCNKTVLHRTIPAHDYYGDPGSLDAAVADLGLTRTDRRYVLFFSGSYLPGTEGRCVQTPIPRDETAGAANSSNTTNPGPILLTTGCYDDWPKDGPHYRLPHALMHNLGAVQAGAPHATRDGHCTTAGDVMCTPDDDGPPTEEGTTTTCPSGWRGYDCGHDDYYSTTPPPAGSYLATHWNVADSVFLAPGPSIAPNTLTGLTIDGPTSIPRGSPVTLTAIATDSVARPGLRYFWDVANNGQCRTVGPADGPSIQLVCDSGSALRLSVGVDRENQYGLRTGYLASVTEPPAPAITSFGPAGATDATVPAGLPLALRVESTFTSAGGTHRWEAPDGCTLTPAGTRQEQARLLCAVSTAGSVRTVRVSAVQDDGQSASAELPVTLTAPPAFSRPTAEKGPWGTAVLTSTLRLPGGAPVADLPVTWWGQRNHGDPVVLGRGVTTSDGVTRLVLKLRGTQRVWVAGEAPGLASERVDRKEASTSRAKPRTPVHKPVRKPAHAHRAKHPHRAHPGS